MTIPPTSAKRAKGILYTSTLHLRVDYCHVANSDALKKISRILDLIYEVRQSVVLPMCSISYCFGNSVNLNIEVSRQSYQCPFGLTMETRTSLSSYATVRVTLAFFFVFR